MSRNSHDWFPFEFRAWLESRRVQRMSLGAQGLYLRMLCVQAIQGNVPTDPEQLALEIKRRSVDPAACEECMEHFEQEVVDGQKYCYNSKLREYLNKAKLKSEQMSENGNKGGRPPKKQKVSTNNKPIGSLSKKPEASLRASKSKSNSNSLFLDDIKNSLQVRLQEFWDIYPRPQRINDVTAAWFENVKTIEHADQIIDHVRTRSLTDREWLKNDGEFIPYPAKFLTGQCWLDKYKAVKAAAAPAEPEPEPVIEVPDTLSATAAYAAWQDIRYHFQYDNPDVLDVWINPLWPIGEDDDSLWVGAPSKFHRDWVAANYSATLAKIIGKEIHMIIADKPPQEVPAMRDP